MRRAQEDLHTLRHSVFALAVGVQQTHQDPSIDVLGPTWRAEVVATCLSKSSGYNGVCWWMEV
jgi:hypothetical protein